MTALEVLDTGPGVTVQDAGRMGQRRFGVSTAGAMDRAALALANALVGNGPEAAALEIPLLGAAMRLTGGAVLVAATGAGAALRVGGEAVPGGVSILARNGDVIEIGAAREGVYTYLAVAGGIDLPPEMGSLSSHLRTGIGPARIATGQGLPIAMGRASAPLRYTGPDAPASSGPIRVVPGPQDSHFDETAWAAFLAGPFRVTPRSDRMGLRREGPRLVAAAGHDIVSEGVVPGSIQVPGDGRPIVLGRDCQTTGGYPKIATVMSAELGRLAQTRPGSPLTLRTVTVEEARRAARDMAAWQAALGAAMSPARGTPANLHGVNLIDGMTRGDP